MIDFTGVNEAVSTTPKYAKPGIAVYTISGMEFKTNVNGKPYAWISFTGAEGETFRDQFYLTADSLPKLQHLAKATTGEILSGQLSNEAVEAKLVGKAARLKVDGEESTKDGKTLVFPKLAFSDFAESAKSETKFSLTDVKVKAASVAPSGVNAGKAIMEGIASATAGDDLPF